MPARLYHPLMSRWSQTFAVGDLTVHAVSDGVFRMSEGFMNVPGFQRAFEDDEGVAAFPIASFVVPGDQTVLIDAGAGPMDRRTLTGGALLDELALVGVGPGDVDLLAVSHLHLDHDGWIATADGEVVFPNATLRVGRGDYEMFVEDEDAEGILAMAPHIKHAMRELNDAGRIEFVDDDSIEIAPGVVAVPTPGHTPGHLAFAIRDSGERLMILGDAMYCPQQLTDADLTAMHDVDPILARRSRELIQREAEHHGTTAVGCHFPGLRGARVVGGEVLEV
jgi:glyoxylase-like metal-dependent hydrolase (beta-lactamase superfamily II)